MPRDLAAKRLTNYPYAEESVHAPTFGGGPPPSAPAEQPISNARLGVLMLIAAETMLFTGLLGAYLVFRFGSLTWPSAQLYLPVGITWVNTFVLLFSCYTMHRAIVVGRTGNQSQLIRQLTITGVLGAIFVGVQGHEWVQLVRDGLTISTGIYGATFYTLIGCHALHVLAAVLWLLAVVWWARQGRFSSGHVVAVEVCGLYWYFVGALWVVLFVLVYLN
jgi:cytochrome c oxidase subunit III